MSRRAAFTKDFLDKYYSLENPAKSRIKQGTEAILDNPVRNSSSLKPPLMPIRSRHSGKMRILYQWCKECRSREVEEEVGCMDCEDHNDETVVFFDLEKRDSSYDHKKRKKIKRSKKRKRS